MWKDLKTKHRITLLGICCIVLFLVQGCGSTVRPQTNVVIATSWLAANLDGNAWPTIGHDAAHTGMYVAQNQKSLPELHGHVVWQQNTGGSVFSAPVLANGTIYIGSTGGDVLALDALTGVVRWRHAIGQFFNDSTPVVVGRVVFVAAESTWILALDATSGKQLWATDTHEVIKAAPTYAGGMVLVNASTTTLALDARTGMVRWRFHEPGAGWPTTAAPAVQGNMVYVVQGTNPVVYALNLVNGHIVWSYRVGERLISTPLVTEQDVIAGTYDGHVIALDKTTGLLQWMYDVNAALPRGMPRDGIAGSPAAANGTIFIGTYDGDILAINAGDGGLLWSRLIDAPVLDVPVVARGTLYVSGGQALYALNVKHGTVGWRLALGDVRNDLALGTGRLYVGTVQGFIYALD